MKRKEVRYSNVFYYILLPSLSINLNFLCSGLAYLQHGILYIDVFLPEQESDVFIFYLALYPLSNNFV